DCLLCELRFHRATYPPGSHANASALSRRPGRVFGCHAYRPRHAQRRAGSRCRPERDHARRGDHVRGGHRRDPLRARPRPRRARLLSRVARRVVATALLFEADKVDEVDDWEQGLPNLDGSSVLWIDLEAESLDERQLIERLEIRPETAASLREPPPRPALRDFGECLSVTAYAPGRR